MEAKNAIIQKVYYESFGSIKQVLQDAKAIDPTIKQQDIKTWKDRTLHRKINLKGIAVLHPSPKKNIKWTCSQCPA